MTSVKSSAAPSAAPATRVLTALTVLTALSPIAVVGFLCLALSPLAAPYWLAAAAASYFLPKSGKRAPITVLLFALLALFSWGNLFAGALLFAVLLAETGTAISRSKQGATLFAAALCMMALLFTGLPAISVFIDAGAIATPIWAVPALLSLALELYATRRRIQTTAAASAADPLLILVLMAITLCYLLAVALLAGSIAYPKAILLALIGGGAVLTAIAVITAPLMHDGSLTLLQHIFALHVPIEKWVEDISAAAAEESSSVTFAESVMQRFLSLPGVIGVMWRLNESESSERNIGTSGRYAANLHCPPLFIRLYTRRRASPWDFVNYYLLARISSEYCRAKTREEQNRADSLTRAVHETGARLTHDIKNILHTLTALMQTEDAQLIRRQLPALRERLETTLTKLQAPQTDSDSRRLDAAAWWETVRARHQHQPLIFSAPQATGDLPPALFDLAADNFIENALIKRQPENPLTITVRLITLHGVAALQVEDTGAAVAAAKAGALFNEPVESESGFGVGLYQVQIEAAKQGYVATLADNQDGAVVFQLAIKKPSAP